MNVRRLIGLPAAAFAATLAAPSVFAEPSRLQVRVPFGFTVNGEAFAPGDYSVSTTGALGAIVAVRGGRSHTLAPAIPLDRARGTRPRLVFHHYGDAYVLRQVWLANGEGHALPASAVERRLRETVRSSDVALPSEHVTAATEPLNEQ